MNPTKTAIDYLVEQLLDNQTYADDNYVTIDLSNENFDYFVKRAKEISQRNIEQAFNHGRNVGSVGRPDVDGKYYFETTFKSE
jgi:hypothetical protein